MTHKTIYVSQPFEYEQQTGVGNNPPCYTKKVELLWWDSKIPMLDYKKVENGSLCPCGVNGKITVAITHYDVNTSEMDITVLQHSYSENSSDGIVKRIVRKMKGRRAFFGCGNPNHAVIVSDEGDVLHIRYNTIFSMFCK